ncbi:hypothetical protein [Naumannella halotolerans]|uniref:Uncharacterized protein n=1 Tax=Naumannella halotolerans TaxID=993414 RepID=A0A4R7JBV3_9ACTN|nr:hypothetical protein [Naumannella halotolerans]TDT33929.1 hypothetical protein CLV29_1565 [Naumannella halotolerans]
MPQTHLDTRSGGPRPAWSQWLLGAFWLVCCPVAPWLGHQLPPYRNPETFWLPLAVQSAAVLSVLWVGMPWWRGSRRPRAADLAFLLGTAIGTGFAFLLVQAVASAYGIRDSALPRLQTGIAMAVDLPYLLAKAAIFLTALALVGLAIGLQRARYAPPPAVIPSSWVPADDAPASGVTDGAAAIDAGPVDGPGSAGSSGQRWPVWPEPAHRPTEEDLR